jgi:hypothetical protein
MPHQRRYAPAGSGQSASADGDPRVVEEETCVVVGQQDLVLDDPGGGVLHGGRTALDAAAIVERLKEGDLKS